MNFATGSIICERSTVHSRASEMIDEAKQAIARKARKHLCLLVLYGSEARGEATPESDIDLLVVLDDADPELVRSLRDAVYDVMWERDFVRLISLHFISLADFQMQKREGYSFIQNVEEEGVVLWQTIP